MINIKAHSIALPSRSLADPKFKPVPAAAYTAKHLRRTWRKARLINRMVKGGTMTHEGNKQWNQGFFDGYNGVPHVDGKGTDYDNGYSRGYEVAQREDAALAWRQA